METKRLKDENKKTQWAKNKKPNENTIFKVTWLSVHSYL